MNKIIGSLVLYLLLGLIWTVICLLILALDAHASMGIDATDWRAAFSRIAYNSFVTLTTVGYGSDYRCQLDWSSQAVKQEQLTAGLFGDFEIVLKRGER